MKCKQKAFDSIKCECGALTAIGPVIDGKVILLGSYKGDLMKSTTGGKREADCLWCGRDFKLTWTKK